MINHVLDYLDRTVERVPDKDAFVGADSRLTFRQLDRISRSIGSFLHREGITREPVLIYMGKRPETIAAFFGVIRAGAFYVPIDGEMPAGRIRLILENCKPRLLICDEETAEAAEKLDFGGRICRYGELADASADDEALAEIHGRTLDIDPIYIVFTSGSTGVPKGVCACHRSVLDYAEQLSETLGFGEDTVFGNQTPLYFDACLKEVYPTIMFGATTYLIPHELFSFPKKLVEYLNENRINTICWVVSALTMISAFRTFDEIVPETLHTVAFGSEVFPMKQYRLWREVLPDAVFYNLYGPTEATGMSCFYRCERELADGEPIPIGRPFKNTEILLLKEDGTLAGADEEGEICIRGTCVTLGYYNDPERTGQSFVQNPLNRAYPERIYRTGDIGRYNAYGELVFVSRRDYQIKHMGHRIELGEIEADVSSLPEIRLCACTYDREKGRIVLHYVGEIEPGELMAALKGMLPRYLLPNRMRRLPEMPLTPNGKIDRKKLEQ